VLVRFTNQQNHFLESVTVCSTGSYWNIPIFVTSGQTKTTLHEDIDTNLGASRQQLAEYVSETYVFVTWVARKNAAHISCSEYFSTSLTGIEIIKQDRQRTHNVTLRRITATIVAVEKQITYSEYVFVALGI